MLRAFDSGIFDASTALQRRCRAVSTMDPRQNLLYGAGIHVCPGAPLARLELRVALESLLGRSAQIELAPGHPPVLATYPASGFASLPSVIRLGG